jgi:hypothetical protein
MDKRVAAPFIEAPLIDRILPTELILQCFEAVLDPIDIMIEDEQVLFDRRMALIWQRAICKRYRSLFPEYTEYLAHDWDTLQQLGQTFKEDPSRGAKARTLLIRWDKSSRIRYDDDNQIRYIDVSTILPHLSSLLSRTPNLTLLSIHSQFPLRRNAQTSAALMRALQQLTELKRIRLHFDSMDDDYMIRWVQ